MILVTVIVVTSNTVGSVFYQRSHVSKVSSEVKINREGDTPIKPYSKNPSYWEYHGKPILLIGGSDCDNIFQWAGDGTKLIDHLNLLRRCGGNYIRCTMSSRSYTLEGYRWDLLPYPFARSTANMTTPVE